ncbi:hypothetical protein CHISP_1836 [Chitinispirillum alkaliphilum]|nr:hypothetical protein CHISP_1836 [Chitinispirillum alkaliphilum]
MNKDLIFIIVILIFGHFVGTITHIIHLIDAINIGFFDIAEAYGVSPVINGYWLSLTAINPLIVFLLIKIPRFGVSAAFINLTVNVSVNSFVLISSIENMSLMGIVNAFGNIYTSLQFALFLFALLCCPLLFRKDNWPAPFYDSLFSKLPLIAFFAGLIIHLIGIYHVIFNFTSLWEAWVHFSMTAINSLMILAVLKKYRIGYLLGIALFGIFGLVQGWIALVHFLGFDTPWSFQLAITISICCLAIVSFLRNEASYNRPLRFSKS